MQLVPQFKTITTMQKDYNSVISLLGNGPVFLTQRGEPAAVMVNPETWNATAKRLAYFERMAAGDKANAEMEAGHFHTQEEFDAIFNA